MNILIFGPNGSGKGTQGAVVQKKYGVPHVESGVIFRENIKKGTELGMKAKAFIDRGELVPDEYHHPDDPQPPPGGGLQERLAPRRLPRNLDQARALWKALQEPA